MASDDLKAALQHLGNFETMSWNEIGRGGSHSISVTKLYKQAQKRLEELRLDDRDELYSFRISGQRRVFGIRCGDLVELLWWDPQHEICPCKKK